MDLRPSALAYGISCGMMRALNGEVAEWSKAHAWKVCIRQRIEGSNPSLTANKYFYTNKNN